MPAPLEGRCPLGRALAFALGYAAVVVVHTALFIRAGRVRSLTGIVRVGRLNVAGAALVIIGGAIGGSAQIWIWSAVAVVEWLVVPRIEPGSFDIGAAHFVERHGLVVIVAIGESVVAIGLGLEGAEVDAALAAFAVLGLALSACLWWTYFGGDEGRAERALDAAAPARRSRLAIEAYGYAHIALLLGVIAIAAGEEEAAHHPVDALHADLAWVLGGGAALYLLADAAFRARLGIGTWGPRALAAVGALIAVPIGVYVSAAAQIVALVVIFAILFAAESRAAA